MSSTIPNKPVDSGPPTSWADYQLYQGVRDALHRLPESFRSPLDIHGVLATDLFAFNSSLITHAAFAAEYRNWWWTYGKTWKASGSGGPDPGIVLSAITQHYPTKSDPISDTPKSDGGNNFGRFARTGLMDDYIKDLFATRLCGIPLGAWQQFFRIFTEGYDFREIEDKIAAIEVGDQAPGDLRGALERVAAVLIELAHRISRPG